MEPISEQISVDSEYSHPQQVASRPLGEVKMPALICGAVGAVLTIILSLIGRYEGLDLSLKEYYMGEPFYMAESNGWHRVWDWLLAVMLTFGVSFAVLDTDKKWRRVMLILLFSVIVIFCSPVLMLWDVFWSPVTVFVGVLWSWICAFIYSCQHTMPCELLLSNNSKQTQEISIPEPVESQSDSEEKYRAKEKLNDQSSCPD